MEHYQNTMPQLIINAPYGSNFLTIPDFSISRCKNWPLSIGYFGSWGHISVAVVVVERFKKESMYGLSAGTKKMAVVESWPLVEFRLQMAMMKKCNDIFVNAI